MTCDLHTHSTYSDGTCSPKEIIAMAKQLGLGAVALTDHNTVSGLREFTDAAEAEGITAVPGVELSTVCDGREIHLLGLFIKPEYYRSLEELVERFHALKEKSNIDLAQRLNSAGYIIDYEAVKKRNRTGNVNRAHFAAELVEKGYFRNKDEVFDTVLDESNGYYVPSEKLTTYDAVKYLKSINAFPVLAHPLEDLNEAELRAYLPELMALGLVGMETRHSDYDEQKTVLADTIAREFGLLRSGGSDFHGTNKDDILLGTGKGELRVPYEFYCEMYSAVSQKNRRTN